MGIEDLLNKRWQKEPSTKASKPKDADVKGSGNRMSVTVGKPPQEPQKPQLMGKITIIDHGSTPVRSGGFLRRLTKDRLN